jgi:hypothetical protein
MEINYPIQKINIVLSEGEEVNWEDPENMYVKYLNEKGKVIDKMRTESGWQCSVRLNGMPQDMSNLPQDKIEWIDPCEELPDEESYVLVTTTSLRITIAQWSRRGGWKEDDSDRIEVDRWLKGLPKHILGNI